MTSQHESLKTELRNKGYGFPDEWFDQCLNWVQEENPGAAASVDNLRAELLSQWYDANLMDLKSECLPPNLVENKCIELRGHYGLQVNCVEDIGEAAYSQWNKLKKVTNENTNVSADAPEDKPFWEPKPRRCLYLTMTDGSQTVYGMELVPIPALNGSELKPGCKMLVRGPLQCRRGVLHLKPQNVETIKGEIDETFAEANSMEQVVKRRLNESVQSERKSNQYSKPKYKRPPSPPNARKPKGIKSSTFSATTTGVNSSSSYSNNASSNNYRNTNGATSSNWNNEVTTEEEEDPFGDGEEIFMDIDENFLIAQALGNNTTQLNLANNTTVHLSQQSTQPLTQNSQEQRQQQYQYQQQQGPSRQTQQQQSTRSTQQQQYTKPSSSTNTNSFKPIPQQKPVIDLVDDDDIFGEDDEFDRMIANAPEQQFVAPSEPKKSKVNVPIEPYQFIKVIKDNIRKYSIGHVVFIKACIATVVSKIKPVDGNWTLNVSLNDGSGFLECKMKSELLNKFIGFTPADMKRMKTSTDPATMARITNGLTNLQTSLVHMNGIFGIQIQRPIPVIVSYDEVTSKHLYALKQRLKVIQ